MQGIHCKERPGYRQRTGWCSSVTGSIPMLHVQAQLAEMPATDQNGASRLTMEKDTGS